MMANELIIKDLADIHSRLFDHHPVLQSEINIFVSEFEEKRNHRECSRIHRAHEYCKEISDEKIPLAAEFAKLYIPTILKSVTELNQKCNDVADKEEKLKISRLDWLTEERKKRVAEWSTFMDEMCQKSTALDKEKHEDILKVQTQYTDLEQKLKIKQ